MRTALFAALLLGAAFALPSPAAAQVDVQIHLGLPVSPPLVVVQPGVQVVENYQDEVFFHSGWYWVRRPPYWYRARAPQAAFALVEPRHVPRALVRLPPGRYRNWRAEARHERHEARDHERAERRAMREQEKHERRHEKAERKARREQEKEQRHGHGHEGPDHRD
jgi:hypothetical protein